MDHLNLMKICKQNYKSFSSFDIIIYSVFCNMYFADCTNNKKKLSVKNRYRTFLQQIILRVRMI